MMKHKIRKPLAVLLTILTILSAFLIPAYAFSGFCRDEENLKESFAAQYGWDTEKMAAYEWTDADGTEYTRKSKYEVSYYEDMYDMSTAIAADLGLVTVLPDTLNGTADSIVALARAEWEEGNKEVLDSMGRGTNNCKYNTWYYGTEVCNQDTNGDGEYWYDDDAFYPWCCVFISYLADACGLIESGTFIKTASVPVQHYYMLNQGYAHFSIQDCKQFGGTESPLPGDILIWGDNDHIGLITAVNDNSIETIEGNSGDQVMLHVYKKSSLTGMLAAAEIFRPEYPDNELKIFYYLVNEMDLSVAAACGVVCNIYEESRFIPTSEGDYDEYGQPTSYGIVGWHNGRWDSLKAYCIASGLDWQTLDGQLAYLKYEMETDYSGLLATLQSIPNTEQGVYDAAFAWCHDFERPEGYEYTNSDARGNKAVDEFWPTYKEYVGAIG